jgi:hypothetical protein
MRPSQSARRTTAPLTAHPDDAHGGDRRARAGGFLAPLAAPPELRSAAIVSIRRDRADRPRRSYRLGHGCALSRAARRAEGHSPCPRAVQVYESGPSLAGGARNVTALAQINAPPAGKPATTAVARKRSPRRRYATPHSIRSANIRRAVPRRGLGIPAGAGVLSPPCRGSAPTRDRLLPMDGFLRGGRSCSRGRR